ncbi:uncharacterized protein LOC135849796 isoform X2 [Planococcus citri]|uniref:uncharacterized protein LOC135849796 isoform X2 n=1 Tax=Planococcus citri TaxID=170843 RepID=UPI0031F94F64
MGNLSLFAVLLLALVAFVHGGDMMRKSIVFDKKTPDVFYCPQQKPKSFDKLYVHAKPLSKLCEFDGKPPPKGYKSDCYHDLDETEYACKEKHRIMKRLPKKSLEKLLEATEQQSDFKE